MLGTDEAIWKDLLNNADPLPKEQKQENKEKTFCFFALLRRKTPRKRPFGAKKRQKTSKICWKDGL